MIKKLRRQFVLVIMSIVFALVVLCSVLSYSNTYWGLRNETRGMLTELLALKDAPEGVTSGALHISLPYFFLYTDGNGHLLRTADTDRFSFSERDYEAILQEAQRMGKDCASVRNYKVCFMREASEEGDCYAFFDISSQFRIMNSLAWDCVMASLLCLLAFFGISILLSGWVVKPVEKAWEQQKRFVSDASHELKTPLTVILTNSELIQMQEYPEEDRRRFAANIETMSQQMKGLIEELLDLACTEDDEKTRACFETLNLSALVEEEALLYESLFFENHKELQFEIEPGRRVKGDEAGLRRVVRSLLDNALKYGEASKPVRVQLSHDRKGRALLSVSSAGEPFSSEEKKAIFRRFYRSEESRGAVQGYGLGLPIVKATVEAHGGLIWADSACGINTFYVQL